MGKYASKTANSVASDAVVGPVQLRGGQRILALSAVILCLAALVAFAFRAGRVRAARSMGSFRQPDQVALMENVE